MAETREDDGERMCGLVERRYTAPLFPAGRGCSDGRSGCYSQTAARSLRIEGVDETAS